MMMMVVVLVDHGDGDDGGADDGNGAVGWPTMDGCQILCPGDDEGFCLTVPIKTTI